MGRIRTIKPEFPQSESVGNLSRDSRLCFIMLWTLADDAGRLRGASRMLASLLFPYDDDAPTLMDKWLQELFDEGCITRYETDGAQYIQITNWLEHQKIDRPSQSKFPPPDEASRIIASPREASSPDQGSRTKDQGPKESRSAQSAFDLFWEAYPRKKGKGAARKAFERAIRKVSAERIIEAVQATRFTDDKQFIPHPSTWLNEERWADPPELLAPSGRANGGKGEGFADPEQSWTVRARGYGDMLAKGRTLGTGATDNDVRRLVKEGYATKDDAEKAGYRLWGH